MKNSKLTSSILALGIVAILGVGSAVAAQGGHYMGTGNTMLTPEQQTQAQTIYADHQKAVGPLMEQMQAKRAELKVLSFDKKVDSAKIQALYRDIADIKAKMFTAKASLRNTFEEKGLSTGGHAMNGMDMNSMGGHGMGGMDMNGMGGMNCGKMMGGDHMGGMGMKGGHMGAGQDANKSGMGAGHGNHI